MKDFILLFRITEDPEFHPTPAQIQELTTSWMNWMGGIAAKDRLVSNGHRLGIKGSKTIAPGNVVTDGPYTEIKEFINGFIIIKAANIDEAVQLASGCPILHGRGKVEVRPTVTPDDFE